MQLEVKTRLQDIDRSIQEIYDFLPEKKISTILSVILKPEKPLNETLKLLEKR